MTLGSNIFAQAGNGGVGGAGNGGNGANGIISLLQVSTITGSSTPGYFASSSDGVTYDDPWTAPGAVTNLGAAILGAGLDQSSITVRLTWTAPGMDGQQTDLAGASVTIRYGSSSISDDATFNSAPSSYIFVANGVLPGQKQTVEIGPLDPSVTWYFAVKTTDTWGNTSVLSAAATVFSYITYIPATAGNSQEIKWADYDRDGDNDAVAADFNNPETLLNNDGSGTFTAGSAGAGSVSLSAVWGDVDRDGDPDILISNASGQGHDLLRNDGGSFTLFDIADSSGFHGRQAAWGDYDNDGDLDAFVANGVANPSWLFRNDGGALNRSTALDGLSSGFAGAAWGDFDNDGDLDLVVTAASGGVSLLRNAGGTFTSEFITTSDAGARVSIGDADGDGDLDALVQRSSNQSLLRNNGGGAFSVEDQAATGANGVTSSWGDFDNDGDLDVVRGDGSGVVLLRNNGAGAFTKISLPGTAGSTAVSAAFGDGDGDGDLDVIVAADNLKPELYLKNSTGVANSAPQPPPPEKLDVLVSFAEPHSTLTFVWSGGDYDAESSSELLHYDVAVSTYFLTLTVGATSFDTGVKSFVIAPAHHVPGFGDRPRPAHKQWPGDAQVRHGVYLSTVAVAPGTGGNLAYATTYYFRVQTIDSGLRRSTWSEMRQLYVPDPCSAVTSVTSGNWSDAATWSGGFRPLGCTPVTIANGHVVTTDDAVAAASTTLVYGTLSFSRSAASRLSLKGDITVKQGGWLDMGHEGSPISTVRAELILALGQSGGQYGLYVEEGSTFTARGVNKSPWGYASADISAGGTSLSIPASQSNGWAVGDEIAIGPTSGTGTGGIERRVLTSVSGGDPNVVGWSGGLSAARTRSEGEEITVVNLTRNVLVRSSGTAVGGNNAFVLARTTVAAHLRVALAEFAYLGASAGTDKGGFKMYWGTSFQDGKGSFSSSTFRDGYRGVELHVTRGVTLDGVAAVGNSNAGLFLTANGNQTAVSGTVSMGNNYGAYLQLARDNAFSRSLFLANSLDGIRVDNDSDRNGVSGSTFSRNGAEGVLVAGGSEDVRVSATLSSRNGLDGLYITGSSRLDAESVTLSSNSLRGLLVDTTASRVRLKDSRVHNNAAHGVVSDGTKVVLSGNRSYLNLGHGYSVENDEHVIVGNDSFSNGGRGFVLTDSTHTLIGNRTWSNAGQGLFVQHAESATWVGGSLGYDPSGAAAADGGAEVFYDNGAAFPKRLEMRGPRILSPGAMVSSNVVAGDLLAIWAQNAETGTVRVFGDVNFHGQARLIGYSTYSWGASASDPFRTFGTGGHSLSVVGVDDGKAVDQLITVEYRSGQWHVDGSVSGSDMRVFTGDQPGLDVPAVDAQFRMSFDEVPSASEGERFEFALLAAAGDVNRQKKVLVGRADSSFNGGRSRIVVSPEAGSGLRLVGAPGQPTILDRVDSGSTYFILIASNVFEAAYASISNVDSDGLQVYTSQLSLSTMTFDFIGVTKATSAYVSLFTSPIVSTNFYGVEFGLSRSTPPGTFLYNVRVGDSTCCQDAIFRRWGGALGGEDFDHDTSPANTEALWAPFAVEGPFAGQQSAVSVATGSARFEWKSQPAFSPFNDPGVSYELTVSTRQDFVPLAGSSVTLSTNALVGGLDPNTTYYARVRVLDGVAASSYTILTETATLANAPLRAASDFVNVGRSSVAVQWVALPPSPASASAAGYVLEASTSPDFSPVYYSSASAGVAQSTLTAGDIGAAPPALRANTTYYFRVASVGVGGGRNYRVLDATSTLTYAQTFQAAPFERVFVTSATLSWFVPVIPCGSDEFCNEGYVLEASSTNFSGGVVLSSRATHASVSKVTVAGLTPFATWYFRLGTLNWNGVPAYDAVVSTFVTPFKPFLLPNTIGGVSGAAWGDMDGDGDLDAAFAYEAGVNEETARNDGGGAFTATSISNAFGNSRALAWGDYDRDGDLDFAVANVDGTQKVMRNDGAGAFQETGTFTGSASGGVAAGDFDNDGDLDLAFANGSGQGEDVLVNDGAGGFSRLQFGTGGDSLIAAWGDYDRDGDLDLAVSNSGGGDEVLYRNDGGTLTATSLLSGSGGDSRGLAWGDADGDGDLDLAVAAIDGAKLYRNDGGSFVSVALPGTLTDTQAAAFGDMDNDGDLDLLFTGLTREPVILRNEGSLSFVRVQLYGAGLRSIGASFGDMDGDGDLDLLLGRFDASAADRPAWVRNDSTMTNAAPSAPSGFGASFSEYGTFSSSGVLTVTWSDASDAETPASQLRYLVRVGTTASGGSDYLRIPKKHSVDGYSGGSWETLSSKVSPTQRGVKLVLQMETTAYIGVLTEDLVGARSAESSEQSIGLVAPGRVTDLAVVSRVTTGLASSSMTVTLTWTSPGGDGHATPLSAGRYDLRYSTAVPMTGKAAYVAAPFVVSIPTASVAPGSLQTVVLGGLDPAVTHYFAVTTLDAVSGGIRSQMSNPTTAFAAVEDPGTPLQAGFGASAGDYDNDGDLDIAVSRQGAGADALGLLRDTGTGFSYLGAFTNFGGTGRGASFVDFDADGDLDAAVTFDGGGGFGMYRNSGGVFASSFSLSASLVQDSAWADADNDGDLDGVLATASGDAQLARNNGDGSLTLAALTGTGGGNKAVAWGDCDGDGLMDVAAAKDGGLQNVWRNQGGGAFGVSGLTGVTGAGRGVAWADYDRDGDLDLVVTFNDQDARLLTNDGTCSFSGTVLAGSGSSAARPAWGDVDGDGDLDLVIARNASQSVVMRNDGGSFVVAPLRGTSGNMVQPVLLDLDDDGDLDLFLAAGPGSRDVLIRNLGTAANQRPARPAALLAADLRLDYDATGSTLTVKWPEADLDAPASSAALNFALAVSTTPMSLNAGDERRIDDPVSFAASWTDASPLMGHFLRPAYKLWPGDASPRHGVQFRLDRPGGRLVSDIAYRLRLQAIDAGLARSSWSLELSTYVFVNVPPQGRAVSTASASSLSVSYSTVTGHSQVVLEASTSPVFATLSDTAGPAAPALQSLTVAGLGPNTTYYLRVGGLYRATTSYAPAVPAATATLANAPVSAASTFTAVSSFSVTVAWGANSNPPGTLYHVILSTELPFTTAAAFASTRPSGGTAMSLGGLEANTTYFLVVRSFNHNGIPGGEAVLGSTVTHSEPPTGVYFEEISSDTIIVAAYAPTPAFRNLHVGLSGTNVAKEGTFQGWRSARTYPRGNLAQNRSAAAAAALGGRIYLVGGLVGGSGVPEVEVYDPQFDVWSSTGGLDPLVKRGGVALGAVGSRLVAAGGLNPNALRRTDVFTLPPGSWSAGADLSSDRGVAAGFALDGFVYAAGGLDLSAAGTSLVERYDPSAGSWSPRGNLVTPRGGAAAAVLGGRAFVLGGAAADVGPDLATVEEYSVGGDSWTTRATMPRTAAQAAAVAVGGKIYLLGGTVGGADRPSVLEYDPAANAFAERMPLSSTRTGAGAAVVSGRIFVAGGYDGSSDLATSEEYDPGTVFRFAGLTPNTLVQFKSKARNSLGVETAESAPISTRTLAAAPTAAVEAFVAVHQTSAAVAFAANNNPFGTAFRVQASTAADFSGALLTADWNINTTTNVVGLSLNTTYHFRAQARNAFGAQTAFLILGSTPTRAAAPAAESVPFLDVQLSSAVAAWNAASNPSGTFYRAVMNPLAADPDGSADETAVTTRSASGALFAGLQGNSTYYLYVRAENHAGLPTAWALVGSTATLPQAPALFAPSFPAVAESSATARWSANGNAAGTLYQVGATTGPSLANSFSGNVSGSTRPFGAAPSITLAGLAANATYQFFAAAVSHSGALTAFTALGSTVTRPAVPAAFAQPFNSVAANSLTVAWSSAGNVPGTRYEVVATSGSTFPNGWPGNVTMTFDLEEDPAAFFTPLDANTTYFVHARAFARDGAPTAYALVGTTMTLAFTPQAVSPAFPDLGTSSAAAQWSGAGNPLGTEYDAALSLSASFTEGAAGNVTLSTRPFGVPGAAFAPLTANTTYHLFARSRNQAGTASPYASLGSTATLAEAAASGAYQLVTTNSLFLSWSANGNPPGTLYRLRASTDANFAAALDVAGSTVPYGAPMTTLSGLQANTTFLVRVTAVNHSGLSAPDMVTASTVTRAAAPVAAEAYSSVSTGSLAASWSAAGNPAGTLYEGAFTYGGSFPNALLDNVSVSTRPEGTPAAGAAGILPNTIYNLFVRAVAHDGTPTAYALVADTATHALAPSAVFIRAVTSGSIVAEATAAAPGFLNLAVNLSGVDLALDGAYDGFASTTMAGFAGLVPNTPYGVKAKARNVFGVESGESATASTRTLAAVPAASGTPFSGLSQTAVTVQWASGGNPAGTEFNLHVATSSDFTAVTADGPWQAALSSAVTALTGNATYHFRVQARNADGIETGFLVVGATATLPNAPAALGTPFLLVGRSSATVAWSGNGNQPGTLYQAVVTTGASFPNSLPNPAVSTRPFGVPQAAFTGLLANATYFFHAAAFSHGGSPTAFTPLGSTVTVASAPAAAAQPFQLVFVSSLTAAWDANGNAPGTLFTAILSTSPTLPFEAPVSTAPEGAPGALFPLLSANATYYLWVRTVARDGSVGSYLQLGSTQTRPAQPGGAAFVSVASGVVSATWPASGNFPGTLYDAVLSTQASFAGPAALDVEVSTRPEGTPGALFAALAADTTYQLFLRAVARDGAAGPYVLAGTTVTLAVEPVLSASTFPIRNTNSLALSWEANGNGPGTLYEAEIADNPGFSPLAASSRTFETRARFGRRGEGPDLAAGTPYFLRVRALNRSGSPTAYTTTVNTTTLLFDAVIPTMTVTVAGDAAWRRVGTTLYDVDFGDQGGSELASFRVSVSTKPGGAPVLAGPTDVVINIAEESYTADWPLPASIFSAMLEGATNYVTVEALDANSNSSTTVDAFFVRKDTTPPSFVNSVSGDTVPRRVSPTIDLDALDAASGLETFQYSASLTQGSGDESVLAWTDLPVIAGTRAFTADWSVPFGSLPDGATSWVSVRARDAAGATTTVFDAFRVIKDTTPPVLAITVPGTPFRSVQTSVSGTAFDALGVQGVEVAVQDPASGLFWTGAAFASASHIWTTAAGRSAWSLALSVPFADGETYRLVARASDTAGNYSPAYATATFTLDQSTPTGRITAPLDGAVLTALAVSGTASDPLPPSGVASGVGSVQLRLRRLSDGLYWDFFNEAFSGVAVSTVASGLASWSVAPTPRLSASLAHGTSYQLTIRTADGSAPGNFEDFEQRAATVTWQDVTPPAAVADLAGSPGANTGESALSWTAPGDDGASGLLLSAEFRIHYATFAAASFSTSAAQVALSTALVSPGSAQAVVVSSLTPGGTYYFKVFTADDDGNWSGLSNTATTYAKPAPFLQITGHVVKTSSEGVTAVLVEAFDSGGARVASAFTAADGSGTFTLDGVPEGVFRVQATWTAGDITSSVWIDNVAMGSQNVDFILEINYTLSTLTGTLASLSAQAASPAGFLARAAADGYKESRVELLRGGARVAEARPDPTGRWTISNLLPGKYAVRAFNGLEFTEAQDVELGEGETREVVFVFDPLPSDSVFAFPNPARHQTTFRFVSGLPGLEAQVTVFDIAGVLVRELPGSAFVPKPGGLYHAAWDLANDQGESVASGVYLFMVKVRGSNGQSGKVIKKLAVVR